MPRLFMNFYETFILTLFDASMYLILFEKLTKSQYNSFKKRVFYVFLITILTSLLALPHLAVGLQQVLNITIVILVFWHYLKDQLKTLGSYIIAYIIATILLYSVQFLIVFAMNLLIEDMSYSLVNGLMAQSIGLLLVYLMGRYVPLHLMYIFIYEKHIWVQVLLINMLIVFVGLGIHWLLHFDVTLNSIIVIAMLCLLSIIINASLLRGGFLEKSRAERIAIYETYLPIINELVDEVRMTQHDYNNQIQTLQSLKKYIENEPTMEAYLNAVKEPKVWHKLLYLENKVLMALLYSKYRIAAAKGIYMQFDIHNVMKETAYTDYELVEIYGIVMDNAIEASQDLEQAIIQVHLDQKENRNFFKVANPVKNFNAAMIPELFEYKKSSKGQGRGIGLYKLSQLLDKYDGQVFVHYDPTHEMLAFEILHG